MQLANTKNGYGWIAIALHWLSVLAILMMLSTGLVAGMHGEAGDREARAIAMGYHVGWGATFFLILLARVVSSFTQPKPTPVEQAKPLMLLASLTHNILLIAILAQVLSGPLAIWSGGRPINVFDMFAIPSPFAARNEGVHEFAELVHAIGRWTIIIAGSLHILAVIVHLFDKKRVLKRMLSPA